jgi:pimeloyl-[acyl-carrier protein] methyl ester esterase
MLVHGWGMNGAVWQALPLGVSAQLRLHPLDLPGHGGRAFDADRVGLPDWAGDCLAQAQAATPEPALWLGWSLGGLVALQAALLAPDRVRALILMTATPRFVQAADWRAAVAERTFDQFGADLIGDPAGTLERFLALQVRGSDGARVVLRRLRRDLGLRPAPAPGALAAGLDLLREGDLRGPLPDVRIPVLWVFGERDTLVPAAVAERVALLLPESRVAVIAGAGHAPFLSHPEAVTAEIVDFLNDCVL